MNEDVNQKIKGIIGLYNFYKDQMNTVQRVALLTLWLEISVEREEYEVANSLQKELDRIISGEEEYHEIPPYFFKILENKPLEPVKKKIRFINQWGKGPFELVRLSFKSFKIILFNFGIEYK